MLQRLLLLLTTVLFYSFQTRAQAYEPGLLVRANGDTLRGEIENWFWVEPPTFIRFRSTPNGTSQLFQPHQIREVSFTKGRCFRYEGLPIDNAAQNQIGFLPLENQVNVKIDSLLAEVLVDGNAILMRVAKPDVIHFLLVRSGQPVLDLSERKYLHKEANGQLAVVDGNNYRAQLGMYFGDCPDAYVAARTATFTLTGLATVVQAYNVMCGRTKQKGLSFLGKDKHTVAFRGGILAGARYNHIESGYNPDYSKAQVRPFAGLYAELFPTGRAIALYGDVTLSDFNGQGGVLYNVTHRVSMVNNIITISDSAVYTYYTYHALLGTVHFGLRYFLPLSHKRQWLFGVGYEFNEIINPSASITKGPSVALGEEAFNYATPTMFPNVTLGFRSQRLTLSLDEKFYYGSNDNAALSEFFSNNFILRLGVSYQLGRKPDSAASRKPVKP